MTVQVWSLSPSAAESTDSEDVAEDPSEPSAVDAVSEAADVDADVSSPELLRANDDSCSTPSHTITVNVAGTPEDSLNDADTLRHLQRIETHLVMQPVNSRTQVLQR